METKIQQEIQQHINDKFVGLKNNLKTREILVKDVGNIISNLTNQKIDEWKTNVDALCATAFTTNFKNDNISVGTVFNDCFKTVGRNNMNDFDVYESGEILNLNVNYLDDSNNSMLSEIIADFDVYKELSDLIFDTEHLHCDVITMNTIIYFMENNHNSTVKYHIKKEIFYVDDY